MTDEELRATIQEIHDSVYEQGRLYEIDRLEIEIRYMKEGIEHSSCSTDYVTGYLSALSTLEGFSALEKETI